MDNKQAIGDSYGFQECNYMEKYEKLSIDALNLSTRSSNLLHREEIHTVAELLRTSIIEISCFRNVGTKLVDEIAYIIDKIKKVM